MGINITIDEKLVKEAKSLTGLSVDSAAVEQLLQRAIWARKRPTKDMLDLVGEVRLRDDYDYKALRGDTHDPD